VASRWRRRLRQEPDRWPVLPLRPGTASNGEYLPPPPTAADRRLELAALDRVAAAAHATGMDRRRFLQTSAGVAAVLGTYNLAACAGGGDRAASRPSTTGADPGGTFDVPEPEDVEACREALAGDEFIFDIHTHHVVPDGPWRQNALRIADMILGLVPPGCAEADPLRCVDRTAYLHDMFLASDTTISLLSDVPNSGPMDAPVPWAEKRETKQLADSLAVGGQSRVLLHDVLAPNFGDLAMRLDEMETNAATGDLAAFKVYTAWGPGGRGFALDDPVIGLPVVDKARELGVQVFCAHKGLPLLEFDPAHNGPDDIVAVAAQYPDMDFVVYHGAYELATTEGPYDAGDAATGVNSLVKAMDDHGVPPNANVHAELGTTWRETLSSPTEAAHVLGKLLARVGLDNVMWGTDAVWYGSPQPQIMAFRAFEIAPELQERYGYPALTPELKAKVLGLNAARLFDVDPEGVRCALDAGGLQEARALLASYHEDGAVTPWQARGPLTRREVMLWLRTLREPWSPA
jgi:predicted TIM-barrel fold metal-dependent hydrolase